MKENKKNSIPASAITLADNFWRLKKFHTRTMLSEKSDKKVIYKCAATQEARLFIEGIAKVEKTNSVYLKEQFSVLSGTLKGDHIEYEYLPYPSLSMTIASKLKQNHCEQADELLSRYVQKVHGLSSIEVYPEKFLSTIGQNTIGDSQPKVMCLSRGLLDLTPRNILVNTDKWIVLDNEWSFDFPIPVTFVLFRAILELVVEVQDEICRTITKTRPAIGLLRRGLRTYYYPAGWVRHISDTQSKFEEMLKWEMGFLRYTTGFKGRIISYNKINNPRTKFSLSTRSLRSNKNVQNVINFIKNLPGAQWFVCLIERLIHLLQKR